MRSLGLGPQVRYRDSGLFHAWFPGETVQEIDQTIKFACASHFDEALFSIATPYAGTEINDLVRATGSYEGNDIHEEWEGVVESSRKNGIKKNSRWLQRKAYFLFFPDPLPLRGNSAEDEELPRCSGRYWGAFTRNFMPFWEAERSRIN